jgi:hypothetical protein
MWIYRCLTKTTFYVFVALIYRQYEKKLWAVIKIQSHARKMIAMRRYRKLKVSLRMSLWTMVRFYVLRTRYGFLGTRAIFFLLKKTSVVCH